MQDNNEQKKKIKIDKQENKNTKYEINHHQQRQTSTYVCLSVMKKTGYPDF